MWQKLILSNNYWHGTSCVTKCGNDSMPLKCSHSLNMENVIPMTNILELVTQLQ